MPCRCGSSLLFPWHHPWRSGAPFASMRWCRLCSAAALSALLPWWSTRARARRGSGGGRHVLRYALPAAERVVSRLASMAPSVVARMASCPARHDAFGCAVCVDAGNALRPTCRAVSARRALSHCHAVASWLWVQQRRARRCAAPAAWFRSLGYRVGRYRYGLRRVGACEYDGELSAAPSVFAVYCWVPRPSA